VLCQLETLAQPGKQVCALAQQNTGLPDCDPPNAYQNAAPSSTHTAMIVQAILFSLVASPKYPILVPATQQLLMWELLLLDASRRSVLNLIVF